MSNTKSRNLESQKDQDAFGILHFPDNYDVEKKEKAPIETTPIN